MTTRGSTVIAIIMLVLTCMLVKCGNTVDDYQIFDKNLPDGYKEACCGNLSTYNNLIMSGAQILRLYGSNSDKVFFICHRGEFVPLQKLMNSNEFGDEEKEYLCTVVSKDTLVAGFVFNESR